MLTAYLWVIDVSEAVTVCIRIPGRQTDQRGILVIHIAVAIVVDTVTDLVCIGIHSSVAIVAIAVIDRIVHRLVTANKGDGIVTESITVSISIPGELTDYGRIRIVSKTVTVIIHTIVTLFLSSRIDSGIAFIAITVKCGIAYTGIVTQADRRSGTVSIIIEINIIVRKGQTVIRYSVAIVVDCVAKLGGAGIACGISIITISAAGNITGRLLAAHLRIVNVTESVTVGVGVPGRQTDQRSILIIHVTVAIIVDAVADLVSIRVNGSICIVAIAVVNRISNRLIAGVEWCCIITKSVAVGICIPSDLTSDRSVCIISIAVTIIVHTIVADLLSGRVDRCIIIVTISISGGVAYTGIIAKANACSGTVVIAIEIIVVGRECEAIVDGSVAIVVHVVAEFGSTGEYRGGSVITIGTISYVARRLCTAELINRYITETICISIGEPLGDT